MTVLTTSEAAVPSHSWRRFFLLLGMFFAAFCLSSFIPTPGSWSDVRSQWLGAAAVAIICVAFLIATARTYWSRGPLTGVQATLLCFIFGVVLVFMVRELFISAMFLREVRSSGRALRTGTPNNAHSVDAPIPFLFAVACPWRRATDVNSSYFADAKRFPAGSIEFDHALVMRDIIHEWHKAEDLYAVAPAA